MTVTVLYPGSPDATLDDLDLIFCIDVRAFSEKEFDDVFMALLYAGM